MDERILLVDDEKRILESLSLVLADMGCYVKTASGPEEALQCAGDEVFQIALVDNYLGPASGIDLMVQMARLNPEMDFVIMSGKPEVELAVEALKKGAVDFIRKPFRIEELLTCIDHVNRKKAMDLQRKELMDGLELKIRKKTEELKEGYLSVLVSFALAVEKKGLGTYGHSKRVSEYACVIAERLGLDADITGNIKGAALLHDIGKIGISDRILAKKEKLNEEEKEIIRSHAQKGAEILGPLKQFESLLPGILHHHESYDGNGYPAGLAGSAIPLAARIIAVADTYDVLLSGRPYQPAADHATAVAALSACAGKQLDPRVTTSFLEALRASSSNGSQE